MPRTLAPMLSRMLERANPNTCHFVEVNAPDVGNVLRRAEDQFLVPLSQTPAGSIAAEPAGALTMTSTSAAIGSFTAADDGTVALPRSKPTTSIRGLAWQVDPSFGRAVLRSLTATIRRKAGSGSAINLALQIYRATVRGDNPAVFVGSAIRYTFVPLLEHPVVWQNTEAAWTANVANPVFDFTPLHLEIGSVASEFSLVGEEAWYYFAIEPVNASADDLFFWFRDQTTSRFIPNVGTFRDRWWQRNAFDAENARAWQVTNFDAAPTAVLALESYVASAQAVYALDLGATPRADAIGRVVFERGVPVGSEATFELSTAGSGGPWTAVTHGDVVTTHQATYHGRLTLTSDALHRAAPRVAAFGVEFKVPVDVTAEAIVTPIAHEVGVPFLESTVGEGAVSVVRFGRRDYRDLASDLASQSASSRLEVDVYLGSRHALVTREHWLLVDRALVSNREPTATAELFGLLSYRKTLKRKIPGRIETINETRVVSAATTSAITVTADLPPGDSGLYDGTGYVRVRQSAQTGVGTGYVQGIEGASGIPLRTLDFLTPIPGTLVAGDVIEIHSGLFVQETLTWADTDPAVIWWQILTTYLLIPEERIGRGDLGRAGRSGLPPTVADRAPGDVATQDKLKVTIAIHEAIEARALIDQLSFIMGGTTVDIAGQLVFRQIYPLRDPQGTIVVPPEPISAVFDARNTTNLNTPVALEQRITTIACDYGVDLTAVDKDAPPAVTVSFADVDALAWLDYQSVDELAPTEIPKEIARWCYNTSDGGLYLASQLTQQVVRAASTGLRVWPWTATELQPQLVIGDRVVVLTDRYTDYDPAKKMPIRGWYAFTLALVSVQGGGRAFRGYMLGLTDALQVRGGPGTLAPPDKTGPVTIRVAQVSSDDATIVVDVYVADAHPNGEPIEITTTAEGITSIAPTTATLTPPADVITDDLTTTAAAQFTITKAAPGAPQGRVTFVATNSKQQTATASIDVVPAGANATGLAIRLHRHAADDAIVEFDIYVADVAPDPDEPIVVKALGQGVTAVVAEDGSQTALVGSRGNMILQGRDLSQAPWSNRTMSAVSFDATVAAPDGTLGVSKLVSTAVGNYTATANMADGDFAGVTLSGEIWLKASVPLTVRWGVLVYGDGAWAALRDESVTTDWQRFEFSQAGAEHGAGINFTVQALDVGTIYVWSPVAVRGTIADVTDDLDTTDFVRFRVTRPPRQVTATNVALESDTLATAPWLGPPTVTENVATYAGRSFSRIAGLTTGPWVQPYVPSVAGPHCVSCWVHTDGVAGSFVSCGLYDLVTSENKAFASGTIAADGTITFAPLVGSLVSAELIEDGAYEVWIRSLDLTAGNNHYIYAASSGSVSSIQATNVMCVPGPTPFPARITTTTTPVTMTVDSPAGNVSFTARRAARFPVSQSATINPSNAVTNPAPTITTEGEATARDGNYQGQVRLLLRFDERTERFDIYASESAAAGGPMPWQVEDYFAGSVTRREGVIGSDDIYLAEFDIGTRADWYRQLAVYIVPVQGVGQGRNGTGLAARFLPVKLFERQASDVGTAPTAPPSAVIVTMSTVNGVPRATVSWTLGDAAASHRVFRNNIFLIRVGPGETTIVDDGLATDTAYTYDVQAVRDGQTSEFASGLGGSGTGGTSDTPTLAAPSFAAGYPFGGSAFLGDDPYVNIRVVNPNAGSATEVWMSPGATDTGTFSLATTIGAAATDVTLLAADVGLANGDTRFFYLVAIRDGYTDSAASAHASATFRPDPS